MKTFLNAFNKLLLMATATMFIAQGSEAAISNIKATSDASNVYYSYSYTDGPAFLRLFLDTDENTATGCARLGVGANFLIENNSFYRYSGINGAWGWTYVKPSNMLKSGGAVSWTISKSDLGNPSSLNFVAQYEAPLVTSAVIAQSVPPVSSNAWSQCAVENGTCTFSGMGTVRYGANGVYNTLSGIGPAPCNNSVFGDPVPGVAKHCELANSTAAQPAPGPNPVPVPNPAPSGSFTKPTLVNPVSPLAFGAKCDGITNDSVAFQAALNSSDVLVPAGKTCVLNSTVKITVSNRHLECGSGAVLKQTVSVGRIFNLLAPSGGRLTGDSIVNCYFLGTNTIAPSADWNNDGKHYNNPVQTQDRVDNFFLAGNTFDRFYGQAMFQTYGAVDGGKGDQIIFNTFKSCGYYGVALVAHQNGLVANNTLVDCALGVENDDAGQLTGGNIFEYNKLTCVYGYGGADMGACTMLTGGATENGADYRKNIVRNNSVSGTSLSSGFHGVRGSRLIIGTNWGVLAAQYSNNTCTNGCVTTP